MHDYLPFVVIGLTTGAVYALSSLGLVLTYRTSGVFNFAHGAVGMFATYLFYSLRQHLPTAPAMVVAVLVVAPLMGLAVDQLFRRLSRAGAAASIVATLGLLVGLQGLATVIYGGEARRLSPLFPTRTYRFVDLNIGIDQTIVVAVALGAGLALIVFFRGTHLGLQTRAVVDNRALSGLVGTNAAAVTRFAWMLGCSFAALSGILFAPFVGLDSLILTLLVVQAFGAAAVGRLQSFPRTAVAAFGVGVLQSVLTKVVGEIGNPALTALPSAVPFIVLFVVLLFSRQSQLSEPPVIRPVGGRRRTTVNFRFPARSLALILAVALVLPPFLNSSRMLTLSFTVAMVLLFASLSLLVGLSRQLSLCHAVFVVFGATTLAHLQSSGVPYLVALPLSALVVVPLGAALAFPAIRLSSLYLGLATFGFGILAESLFPTGWVFGSVGFVTIDRPGFLDGDVAFYYFVLAVVAAGVVAVEMVRVTRLGRILVALADSPRAVGSMGISPLAARVVTFCVSAFLAGLAGGLLGSLVRSVSSTSFSFFQSLLWVTVLVAAGSRTVGGVVLGAVLLVAVPATFTSSLVTEWQPVAFGALAIVFAQAPNGLAGFLGSGIDTAALAERYRWRLGSTRGADRLAAVQGVKALQFDHVSAGYGRTTVLRDVSLAVPQGKTVALLGANGAGKTTLLRTAAGLVRPTAGEIHLGDERVDQRPEHARTKLGLCLVPEGHAIFRSLTVRENLAMYAGGRAVDAAVDRAAAAFPVLGQRLTQVAGTLSGGEQQMLALTRALIVDARVILADELSMGLAPVIVDEIFAVVDMLRGEGRSLLIVEQFVSRALAIADYVYILHKGTVAFVGEPGQCRQDERLFEQYVGSVA